jgi:hypothetical protein
MLAAKHPIIERPRVVRFQSASSFLFYFAFVVQFPQHLRHAFDCEVDNS